MVRSDEYTFNINDALLLISKVIQTFTSVAKVNNILSKKTVRSMTSEASINILRAHVFMFVPKICHIVTKCMS